MLNLLYCVYCEVFCYQPTSHSYETTTNQNLTNKNAALWRPVTIDTSTKQLPCLRFWGHLERSQKGCKTQGQRVFCEMMFPSNVGSHT